MPILPLLFYALCAVGMGLSALKLCDVIAWSWFWTLSPFMAAGVIAVAIIAIVISANLMSDGL